MIPQIQFELLGFGVNGYWLCHLAGTLVTLPIAAWLMRERGHSFTTTLDCWVIPLIIGFVFSRLFCALGGCGDLFPRGTPFLTRLTNSGASAMGAVPAVTLGMCLIARFHPALRHDSVSAMDPLPVCFAVCDGLGRLGCFLAGCCHGKPAFDLPWAVVFHPSSSCVYQGIPVHPTQLYHATGAFALAGGMLALWNRPSWRGTLLWVWLAGYGVLRFFVEFFRGDPRPMLGVWSWFQILSLVYATIGALLAWRQFQRNTSRNEKSSSILPLSNSFKP